MMKRFLAFLTLLMCVHAPVFGADLSDKYSDHAQNLRNWFVGDPDITSTSDKTTFTWPHDRRSGLNAILQSVGTKDMVAFNAQLVKELCAGAGGTVSRVGPDNSFVVGCDKPGLSANAKGDMTTVFRRAHCAGFCRTRGRMKSFGKSGSDYSCVCNNDPAPTSGNRAPTTPTVDNTATINAAQALITSECFGVGWLTCTDDGHAKLDCPAFKEFNLDNIAKKEADFDCNGMKGPVAELAGKKYELTGSTPRGQAENLIYGICYDNVGRVSCVTANGLPSVSIECQKYQNNPSIGYSTQSVRGLCANKKADDDPVVFDSLTKASEPIDTSGRFIGNQEPEPRDKADGLLRSVCYAGRGRVSCSDKKLKVECVEFNRGLENLAGLDLDARIKEDTAGICTNSADGEILNRSNGGNLTEYSKEAAKKAVHPDEDLGDRVLTDTTTPPATKADQLLRVACVDMIGRVSCVNGNLRLECAEFQPGLENRAGFDDSIKSGVRGICTDNPNAVILNNDGGRNDLQVYGAPDDDTAPQAAAPDDAKDANNDGDESDGVPHTVTGTVVDKDGPVFAADVVAVDKDGKPVVKALSDGQSSKIGTITDVNGYFEFKFPAEVTHVQISSLGYKSMLFPVDKVPTQITLEEGLEGLEGALNIGGSGDKCKYYDVCKRQNNCLGDEIVSAAQWLYVPEERKSVCIPTKCATEQYKLERPGTASATCVDQVGKTCKPEEKIDKADAYEYVWQNEKLECVLKSCKDKYEPATDKKSCVQVGGTCQPKDKNATKGRLENKVCVATDCKKGYRVENGKCAPIDGEYSAEEIAALQDNYDKMKANEQSITNRAIGAVGVGATGIGAMTAASALAEQRADADAERDMKAYLETMRCDYGRGMNIKGGETGIELPGGNDLAMLHLEYALLVESLTEAKAALGLKPGIEAEATLDKAETGLYDNGAIGKTGGAYFSIARALQDPQGTDATEWEAQKAAAKKKLKTGAIVAGVGAAGSLIANLIANADAPKNEVDKIKSEHDKRIREAQAGSDAKIGSQTTGQTDASATGTDPVVAAESASTPTVPTDGEQDNGPAVASTPTVPTDGEQ